jgi:hypothetical protein
VVGGEADAQQQENGQGAILLDAVHLAGHLVDPHQHGNQEGHQGVLGQKARRHRQHGQEDEGKGLGALDTAQ